MYVNSRLHSLSLSARRAWIEIPALPERYRSAHVALRKESVDRNFNAFGVRYRHIVALRKESVDRNVVMLLLLTSLTVALRKESVDRNKQAQAF